MTATMWPSSHIDTLKKQKKMCPLWCYLIGFTLLSHITYSSVNYIYHVVHYISGTYLSYNLKFVPFDFFFFWPCHAACRVLAPQPGIEPRPSAFGAQSLNHWTARESPFWLSISNTLFLQWMPLVYTNLISFLKKCLFLKYNWSTMLC